MNTFEGKDFGVQTRKEIFCQSASEGKFDNSQTFMMKKRHCWKRIHLIDVKQK